MPTPLGDTLKTILVVDDDNCILQLVVAILKRANFRVLFASSGPEALLLAERTGRIDLLLSDINMPGMCGPELGERLKKMRPDLHVMLMSGGDNGLVLNHGWAYLRKPSLSGKLVGIVTEVLHNSDRSQLGGTNSTAG